MSQWYVKELSELTKVSVQTLHHYDKIDLLKPSVRLPNGYRLYSEQDLFKLQQIVALKFFGFQLKQIRVFLKDNQNSQEMIEHFREQSLFLAEKASALQKASESLQSIISCYSSDKSLWKTIIQLIEVFQMTQNLEKSWAGKIFDQEELKEYADFEQGLKTRFTESQKKEWEQKWDNLTQEINDNLSEDPKSAFGIDIGKRAMEMVNALYGKKHAKLRMIIWEKGYKGGLMDKEHAMPLEIVDWLDKATEAYYHKRIHAILSQVAIQPEPKLTSLWEELLNDMCGESDEFRAHFYHSLLEDKNINSSLKSWLKEQK